ncbi:MAG: chemotaxis protein CheX [bacterium]|nr:chemotaxis protein CheX [bacterium]
MSNQMKTLLLKTAVRTFEDLGFLLPTEEVDDEQAEATIQASAIVKFRGPFEGVLVIRLFGDPLPELAANMLGEETPPDRQQQLDAFGELANVTCGNVLPAIAGYDEVFDLDEPIVDWESGEDSINEPGEATADVQLGLDEGRADLLLYVHGNVPV